VNRLLRLHVPVALAAALLAPACGQDTPTLSDVARAIVQVTVAPNPVPASQNSLTGAVSIGYKVTIAELAGLGGEVLFVSSQVFDPETGLLVGISYFDGVNLVVFVGSKRVEPAGTLVVPKTISYLLPDLRTSALLAVTVQVRDDRDNLINQSVLVKVEQPPQ